MWQLTARLLLQPNVQFAQPLYCTFLYQKSTRFFPFMS